MAKVALTVSKRRLLDLDDIIDQKNACHGIKDTEWFILAQDELNQDSLAKKKHEAWMSKIEHRRKFSGKKKVKKVKNCMSGQKRSEKK